MNSQLTVNRLINCLYTYANQKGLFNSPFLLPPHDVYHIKLTQIYLFESKSITKC